MTVTAWCARNNVKIKSYYYWLPEIAHAEGYCVVVVTHDLEIAEKADVIYRMKDGVLFGK